MKGKDRETYVHKILKKGTRGGKRVKELHLIGEKETSFGYKGIAICRGEGGLTRQGGDPDKSGKCKNGWGEEVKKKKDSNGTETERVFVGGKEGIVFFRKTIKEDQKRNMSPENGGGLK